MATSSCSCFFAPLQDHNKSQNFKLPTSTLINGGHNSFLGKSALLQLQTNTSSKRVFVVRNASPEAAGDLLSSFSLPSLPGFSDNPWVTGIAGLVVVVPFMLQRLLTLTREVDMAAQTIEKIADAVGKVAEEVDKAAEDIAEALPEGGLKKVVSFVEDLAEETVKDAQKVEDLMDKVEELDDKLEEFLERQTKGTTEKA